MVTGSKLVRLPYPWCCVSQPSLCLDGRVSTDEHRWCMWAKLSPTIIDDIANKNNHAISQTQAHSYLNKYLYAGMYHGISVFSWYSLCYLQMYTAIHHRYTLLDIQQYHTVSDTLPSGHLTDRYTYGDHSVRIAVASVRIFERRLKKRDTVHSVRRKFLRQNRH